MSTDRSNGAPSAGALTLLRSRSSDKLRKFSETKLAEINAAIADELSNQELEFALGRRASRGKRGNSICPDPGWLSELSAQKGPPKQPAPPASTLGRLRERYGDEDLLFDSAERAASSPDLPMSNAEAGKVFVHRYDSKTHRKTSLPAAGSIDARLVMSASLTAA